MDDIEHTKREDGDIVGHCIDCGQSIRDYESYEEVDGDLYCEDCVVGAVDDGETESSPPSPPQSTK